MKGNWGICVHDILLGDTYRYPIEKYRMNFLKEIPTVYKTHHKFKDTNTVKEKDGKLYTTQN